MDIIEDLPVGVTSLLHLICLKRIISFEDEVPIVPFLRARMFLWGGPYYIIKF